MIALGIRYLTGYAVATDPTDRTRPEWPPHPARVFMALAAAHFETGAAPGERAVLEWLEAQESPALRASPEDARSTVTVYVPVNDTTAPRKVRAAGVLTGREKEALGLLPGRRNRQGRAFPRARPHSPDVYLIWPTAALAGGHRDALEDLCAKVTRVGHSSSLVQMWVEDDPPEPNLHPTDGLADRRLRITSPGFLEHLEHQFQTEQRPRPGLWGRYARSVDGSRNREAGEPARGAFQSDLLLLTKQEGPRLGLESTLQLTRALRGAALSLCPEPVPEWLSGHRPDGGPSERPHTAFLPLPFVGYEHGDGHIMGLAIALPRESSPEEPLTGTDLRHSLGRLFFEPETGEPRPVTLRLGRLGVWTLARETRETPPHTLRRETWTRPSRRWASVTPVVLHHYPKKNRDGDVERIVRAACRMAGLPDPKRVVTLPVSRHRGAGHALGVPQLPKDGACRYQTHAEIEFEDPVRGPVLIGRGRYRGYGLCRPLSEEVRR